MIDIWTDGVRGYQIKIKLYSISQCQLLAEPFEDIKPDALGRVRR